MDNPKAVEYGERVYVFVDKVSLTISSEDEIRGIELIREITVSSGGWVEGDEEGIGMLEVSVSVEDMVVDKKMLSVSPHLFNDTFM